MSPESPASLNRPSRSRRRRPGHRWEFERLECRTLLASSPIVASPRELAGARPIGGEVATGLVAPGSKVFFRLDTATDQLMVATLHASGASARLTLLDGQGRELTRSEGRSVTDRNARISQHLGPGTDYLEVEGLAGAGPFRLTTSIADASNLNQSLLTGSSLIALDDFNGDGHLDLAAGDAYADRIGLTVLLGAGDGTFGPPDIYLEDSYVGALAIGDVNGDGRPDLIADHFDASDYSEGGLAVLLGVGDGTFGPPTSYLEGSAIYALASGDFNGDGRPDLAAGGDGLSVLPGVGDGTFGPPASYLEGPAIYALASGDVNGDGRPDLAAGGDGLSVLLGAGDGTFGPPDTYLLGGSLVYDLALVDVNGDGQPDLIASKFETAGLSVLLGAGDGTFGPPANYLEGSAIISPAELGDVNGDGRPDVYTADGTFGSGLTVLPGVGDGTFGPPANFLKGSNFSALALGDFNGDGRPDLAASESYEGVLVLLGAGDGTFGPPASYLQGYASNATVGDFNGDGRPDLAAYQTPNIANEQGLSVLLGVGDGTFGPPANYLEGSAITALASGDFNGDGRPDLVAGRSSNTSFPVSGGGLSVLLGVGDGTFGPPANYLEGSYIRDLVLVDVNGDGRPDLVVSRSSSYGYVDSGGGLSVLLGVGDGTFGPPANYLEGSYIPDLALVDVNGDGRSDLVVSRSSSNFYVDSGGGLSVLLGVGDGTFGPPANYLEGSYIPDLALVDVNGDGRPDLVAAATDVVDGLLSQPKLAVLLGVGGGTFGPPATYLLGGSYISDLVLSDVNGDGRPDLAVIYFSSNSSEGGLAVLLGVGDGTFGPPDTYLLGGSLVYDLALVDVNGDGQPDLIASQLTGDSTGDQLAVLLGVGDGTFGPPASYFLGATFPPLTFLTVTDFNGDGRPDLASTQALFLNAGDGSLVSTRSLVVGIHANPLVIDPNGDLAVLEQTGDILLRRSAPGQPGRFQPPIVLNPGSPALDITVVSNGGRALIAAADAGHDSISFYDPAAGAAAGIGGLSTGRLPAQLLSADLNGDGTSDLVLRNAGDGSASIFLGRPGGGFHPMPGLSIGLGASDISLADLDGSGHLSLVVTNQVSGDVRVYAGRSDGTFGPPSRYQAGAGPYAQEVGPDGTTDLTSNETTSGVAVVPFTTGGPSGLVTINPGSNTFAVLQGLGGGTLANARIIRSGEGARLPYGINSAKVVRSSDFDGDGRPDLALLGTNGVTVYLGDGRGEFRAQPPINVGPAATGLTIADVDRDGQPDLLVGNTYGDVLILLGNGDGTFAPYRKADRSIAMVATDLDGDGQDDFIYANQGLDRVTVSYSFGPRPVIVGSQAQGLLSPGAVTLADLNGDGIPDLIVANSGSNNVLVYPGLGGGQFGPAANGGHGFFTGTNPVGLNVADLNGDGIPDLVVANQGSNDVSVLYGRGRGTDWTLDPGPRLEAGSGPASMVVMDVNKDGNPDLLVSESQSNQVRLLPGVGQGFFNDQSPTLFPVGTDPGPLFVGDFAGPAGGLDLVTVNAGSNDLTLIRDFAGGLVPQGISIASQGIAPTAALSGDFTGDGLLDLLVANSGDGTLALFLGGLDDLELFGTMNSPEAPSPTSLALDALSGNVLQFYAGTAGEEAAIRLAFNLSGLGGGEGPTLPPPPSTTDVQQVARLQPLGNATSLPLVATLLSLTVQETAFEESDVEPTVSDTSGRLPNQPVGSEDREVNTGEEDDETDEPPTPPDPSREALSPLLRFLYGLDEAFERARRESSETRRPAGAAERSIQALDHLLGHWSPVLTTLGGPTPALAGRLIQVAGQAARAVDHALQALPTAAVGDPSIRPGTSVRKIGHTPMGRLPIPPIVAAVSLGLVAAVRTSGDRPGRRSGPSRDRSHRSGPATK